MLMCKYSHYGWYQATNMKSPTAELGRDMQNGPSAVGANQLQQTTGHLQGHNLLSQILKPKKLQKLNIFL